MAAPPGPSASSVPTVEPAPAAVAPNSPAGDLPVLDFANMLAGVLPRGGIAPAMLKGELTGRFCEAFEDVQARRAAGEIGFFGLPGDHALSGRTREAATAVFDGCEAVVVVGIGGSALGARALRDALLPPAWNELAPSVRGGRPRIHVLDNPDPRTVSALTERLDLSRTFFNFVSKSGATSETLAHFLVIHRALVDGLGPRAAERHVLFTTGPTGGAFRRLAAELGAPTLAVPENVGGRFSVLSPAGMFPAAAAGIDTRAVLDGASDMARRCATPELGRNPAGMLAVLLHLAATGMGAPIHVFMPYADRARALAAWFQQLWAESLGKSHDRRGAPVGTGPTPLPAAGAQDQHSLLQLFMEGPRDKVAVFLGLRDPGVDVPIPAARSDDPAFAHLAGRTLFQLLDAERRATAEALRRAGRPNMTIMADRLDARNLGALFMLLQIAVVYSGALYGVDPLNQPGVELAKRLTRDFLLRDAAAGRSPSAHPPETPRDDSRWQV